MLSAGPQSVSPDLLMETLDAGDVACMIFRDQGTSAGVFEAFCREVVPLVQSRGCAALVFSETQIMGRVEADGLYTEASHGEVRDYVARFSPHKLVGCGGMMNRHSALIYGETNPDFVMFGKLGKDIRPQPHPKNLDLAAWWAELVEVPGVVLGGNEVSSVVAAAQTGCEFVLLEQAVFEADLSPADAVSRANQLLDEHAPPLVQEV